MAPIAQRAGDPVFHERPIDLRMCIRRSDKGHARQLRERDFGGSQDRVRIVGYCLKDRRLRPFPVMSVRARNSALISYNI